MALLYGTWKMLPFLSFQNFKSESLAEQERAKFFFNYMSEAYSLQVCVYLGEFPALL